MTKNMIIAGALYGFSIYMAWSWGWSFIEYIIALFIGTCLGLWSLKRKETIYCPKCKAEAPVKWFDKENNICELCKPHEGDSNA